VAEEKRYLKLPPEMADGQNCTLHPLDDMSEHDARVLADNLHAWAMDTQAEPGEVLELTVVALTDEAFEALPEI
jgi:hypothetical protein